MKESELNNNNFVNLIPLGLTRGARLNEAYILIFREVEGMRCMAALISPEEYNEVRRMMQGAANEIARTLRNTLDTFGIKLHCVVIHNNTRNNDYCTELVLQQDSDVRTVRQSVGVGTVIAMQLHVPLQVGKPYFESMAGEGMKEDGTMEVRVPFTAMDKQLLEEAMEQAVKEDNFEMAKALRDEIARRDAMSHTSSTTEI